MKRFIYTIVFIFSLYLPAMAQDDDGNTVREKMVEYIQQKLGLTKGEAEKFAPVYMDYFRELRKTNQDYKGDRLVLQQKIVELRLKYRDQFRPIIGEKRSNDVFTLERDFIQKVRSERDSRLQNRPDGPANKRLNALIH